MARTVGSVLICAMLVMSTVVFAGTAEDANAAIERWSAAYSSNDVDVVVQCYWPDAMVLGTVSPVMSEARKRYAPISLC
jgi:ketosteroid isomerase-like protein